jgi:hypothetical protein
MDRPCIKCGVKDPKRFQAAWVLRNCLPWFLMKQEQAKVVIEHQESTTPDNFNRGSGIRTPQDILEYRQMLKNRITELNKRGASTIDLPDTKEA